MTVHSVSPIPPRERFLEVDALRGAAVVLMVVYHFLFDYAYFVQPLVDVYSGWAFVIGRTSAILFVGLAGLSWTLHTHRKHAQLNQRENEWRVYVRRGIVLLCGGLGISLATFLLFPANAIWFGVLHLLGLSFIIGIPFLHRPRAALGGGILFTLVGLVLSTVFWNSIPFWPILLPVTFPTFDYFPLLPWFGVFLLGIFAGHYLYPHGKAPEQKIIELPKNVFTRLLATLGKKSLLIYLVHQPILIGIILLARGA